MAVIAKAAVLDAALIVLFALLGRSSHHEALAGSLGVAAPFLIGAAVGWLAARAWQHPTSLRTGVLVWAGTIVVGMLLRRTVFGRGVDVSFVIVASLFTALFLVGWRVLAHRRSLVSAS